MVTIQRAYLKRILRQKSIQKLASVSRLLSLRLHHASSHPHLRRLYSSLEPDSWDIYTLTLYEPVLTFQNYQSTCLQSTGTAIYDSSFSNELSTKSYQSYVSAGGEGSDLVVSGSFTPTGITACTILLYFQVTIAVNVNKLRIECPQLQSFLSIFTKTPQVQLFLSLRSAKLALLRPN